MSEKIDLISYIHLSGPGVDAFERRKEAGSNDSISEAEMRASYIRVKDRLLAGVKTLVEGLMIFG